MTREQSPPHGHVYQTIRMLEHGIKAVYVFDGKPPQLKSGELEKRGGQRLKNCWPRCRKQGSRRTLTSSVSVWCKLHVRQRRAALVKVGKVVATATDDMDGLTFGTGVLLRHLTTSDAKKLPIQEFHFTRLLQDINLTHEQPLSQFIDLCILQGCDYPGTIKGIVPKRAIDLIRQHGSIEEVLENIDPSMSSPVL
ncbi:hypothetical protein J4Q44_G00297820 [Coregonus suidteri]|uniref:XPG-I domain-containing protein n=1 Tax=Coregonus suidteri TaxID=861788 RepID=A0AAN8QCK4_9TELE